MKHEYRVGERIHNHSYIDGLSDFAEALVFSMSTEWTVVIVMRNEPHKTGWTVWPGTALKWVTPVGRNDKYFHPAKDCPR